MISSLSKIHKLLSLVSTSIQFTLSRQKVDLTKYIEETVFNFDFAFDELTSNEQVHLQIKYIDL